ncbi:MAG: hypothetical protein KJZ93_20860 [Caldilineaceae bacterium]|nr:hypothetical protein [Caldilineaceae bacterium]
MAVTFEWMAQQLQASFAALPDYRTGQNTTYTIADGWGSWRIQHLLLMTYASSPAISASKTGTIFLALCSLNLNSNPFLTPPDFKFGIPACWRIGDSHF